VGFVHALCLFGCILIVVAMKFTAPKTDNTPAKCSEKMAKSIDPAVCAIPLARGG
jgi:hypothetical protein